MKIDLLPNINDNEIVNLPNWSKIFQHLDKEVTKRTELSAIHRAHTNTKTKILFADYHYNNLNQIYIPN